MLYRNSIAHATFASIGRRGRVAVGDKGAIMTQGSRPPAWQSACSAGSDGRAVPRAFVGNDGSARWSPAPLVRASFGLSAAAVVGAMALPVAWPWFGGAILANHALL